VCAEAAAAAHSEYARKHPQPPQFWLNKKKNLYKNIRFTMGNDNIERNPKSAPKKFSRLCTFKALRFWAALGKCTENTSIFSCLLYKTLSRI